MTELHTSGPAPPRDAHWLSIRPWLWSLLAATPFLLFPLIHYIRWGSEATGLTVFDLPYYAANARAVLDRGHAGLYPNAFDPDAAAPVIYFHWLILVLAGLVGPLGLDPGHAFLLIQILGAVTSARVMYSLIAWLIPNSRHQTPLFLLTMWSGGLLVASKLMANLVTGSPWNEDLLALDPGQGQWFLNFGRNLILPTEAVYHALMVATWLAILCRRWGAAILLLVATTTTHPFTGAQSIAIVGGWIAFRFAADFRGSLLRQTRRVDLVPLWFSLVFMFVGGAFVAYYFAVLPMFPQHQVLQQNWTLAWVLPLKTIPFAYGPAAILAWFAIRHDPAWRKRTAFLLVAAGVSFLLANHQWFITPHQPIHFTRGYIWTPLWLVGLPTLSRAFDYLQSRFQNGAPIALGLVSIVAVFDNAAFLAISATSPEPTGYGLTSDERLAFADLRQRRCTGILMTDTLRLGYLAAVYTSARPWFGHYYNTPHRDLREASLKAFRSTSAVADLLEVIDLALTADPQIIRRLQDAGWQKVTIHGDLQLWQKP